MRIRATRGSVRENDDGTATVPVTIMVADIGAVLQLAAHGKELFLCDAGELERVQTGPKPPPTTIAPKGAAVGFVGPAGALPEMARPVIVLAADPVFQEYSVLMTKAVASEIEDAYAHAVWFVCSNTGAKVPADFDRPEVQVRFKDLFDQFKTWEAKRQGGSA